MITQQTLLQLNCASKTTSSSAAHFTEKIPSSLYQTARYLSSIAGHRKAVMQTTVAYILENVDPLQPLQKMICTQTPLCCPLNILIHCMEQKITKNIYFQILFYPACRTVDAQNVMYSPSRSPNQVKRRSLMSYEQMRAVGLCLIHSQSTASDIHFTC